jgi:hypothetical protein
MIPCLGDQERGMAQAFFVFEDPWLWDVVEPE